MSHDAALHSPISRIETMDERLNESVSKPRFTANLLFGFACFAVFLGIIGVYGVMGYRVRSQTKELAVRQAVGVQRSDITSHILRQGLRIVGPGLVFGLLGSLSLSHFLSSMLYDVKPNDPATLVSISVSVIVVAMAACWIPALRAAAMDPLVSLRQE